MFEAFYRGATLSQQFALWPRRDRATEIEKSVASTKAGQVLQGEAMSNEKGTSQVVP